MSPQIGAALSYRSQFRWKKWFHPRHRRCHILNASCAIKIISNFTFIIIIIFLFCSSWELRFRLLSSQLQIWFCKVVSQQTILHQFYWMHVQVTLCGANSIRFDSIEAILNPFIQRYADDVGEFYTQNNRCGLFDPIESSSWTQWGFIELFFVAFSGCLYWNVRISMKSVVFFAISIQLTIKTTTTTTTDELRKQANIVNDFQRLPKFGNNHDEWWAKALNADSIVNTQYKLY